MAVLLSFPIASVQKDRTEARGNMIKTNSAAWSVATRSTLPDTSSPSSSWAMGNCAAFSVTNGDDEKMMGLPPPPAALQEIPPCCASPCKGSVSRRENL
jgi:hypothetical protein